MTEIRIERLAPERFKVHVVEGESRTAHHVDLPAAERDRYAPEATPEELLEASFRFLLEREPKESILQSFELSVIERYFPEYPAEIRRQLQGAKRR